MILFLIYLVYVFCGELVSYACCGCCGRGWFVALLPSPPSKVKNWGHERSQLVCLAWMNNKIDAFLTPGEEENFTRDLIWLAGEIRDGACFGDGNLLCLCGVCAVDWKVCPAGWLDYQYIPISEPPPSLLDTIIEETTSRKLQKPLRVRGRRILRRRRDGFWV